MMPGQNPAMNLSRGVISSVIKAIEEETDGTGSSEGVADITMRHRHAMRTWNMRTRMRSPHPSRQQWSHNRALTARI